MLLEIDADHFGPEVRKAFGDTVEDVAEAASCLGLERSTACVFHLMRALEAAAAVVASKIGATVEGKNRQNAEGQRRTNKVVQGPVVSGSGEPGLARPPPRIRRKLTLRQKPERYLKRQRRSCRSWRPWLEKVLDLGSNASPLSSAPGAQRSP